LGETQSRESKGDPRGGFVQSVAASAPVKQPVDIRIKDLGHIAVQVWIGDRDPKPAANVPYKLPELGLSGSTDAKGMIKHPDVELCAHALELEGYKKVNVPAVRDPEDIHPVVARRLGGEKKDAEAPRRGKG
jgi:hypothetical protein